MTLRWSASPLVAAARRGERITLAMKIETAATVQELDAMLGAIGARGQDLTDAERNAVARRLVQLGRKP